MKPGLYEQIISTYVAELLQHKMDSIFESAGESALAEQIEYINNVIKLIDCIKKGIIVNASLVRKKGFF